MDLERLVGFGHTFIYNPDICSNDVKPIQTVSVVVWLECLPSVCMIDRWFESRSGQTKHYKSGL